MTVTALLAPEHDLATTNALLRALHEMGAEEISRNWGVAGSQEISMLRFSLGEQQLIVEAETYIGLSVTGTRETVDAITSRVRDIVGKAKAGFPLTRE
ncbi:hypothetical protein [Sphingopyxis sp. KK2]|uniref:hypothetical protein n=1 Tax=Sphingopyxis sp. KK2 TaxID=1855727 RepID=UPI001181A618|nr:hypothetical protein [Sphingopyxis sp. KK2]